LTHPQSTERHRHIGTEREIAIPAAAFASLLRGRSQAWPIRFVSPSAASPRRCPAAPTAWHLPPRLSHLAAPSARRWPFHCCAGKIHCLRLGAANWRQSSSGRVGRAATGDTFYGCLRSIHTASRRSTNSEST